MRNPPSAVESEKSLLSSLLIGGDSVADQIFELVEADDFYSATNRFVFMVAQDIFSGGAAIDVSLMVEGLSHIKWQSEVQPAVYLAQLMDEHPVATNIAEYANRVRSAATRRRLISICGKITHDCYQVDAGTQDLLEAAQREIVGLSTSVSASNYSRGKDLFDAARERYETLYQNNNQIVGVPTGYRDLDYVTCGFNRGDSVYIAARPSMGKTALMVNVILNQMLEGYSVGVFSIEMGEEQIIDRMLAAASGINLMRFRSGQFIGNDLSVISSHIEDLRKERFCIDDTGSITIEEIVRKSKAMALKDKVDIVWIDYIGLIQLPKNSRSVNEGVSIITRRLKLLAKELQIPVVCLSQLNRELERRENKRPILSDLRDSGSLEQDADVVVFIYRDEVYNKNTRNPGTAEIIIAKQRNGPTATRVLKWEGRFARFDNVE